MKWQLISCLQLLLLLLQKTLSDETKCTKKGQVNKISGLFYGLLNSKVTTYTLVESLYILEGNKVMRLSVHQPYGDRSIIVRLRAILEPRSDFDFARFSQNYDKFYADDGIVLSTRKMSPSRMQISQTRYSIKTSVTMDAYLLSFEIEDPAVSNISYVQFFAPAANILLSEASKNLLTKLRFDPLEPMSDTLRGDIDLRESATVQKFPFEMVELLLTARKADFFIPYRYKFFHGPHTLGLFTDGRYRVFKSYLDKSRLRLLESDEVAPKIEIFECVH